ncbi:MAG: hypothetical protein ACI4OH_05195 [Mitsuokella sp.]|uniref:hypothetical protein n=1 Tax=Mitsuokella sp. TaxID=2049034 RepID=UPI003F0B8902
MTKLCNIELPLSVAHSAEDNTKFPKLHTMLSEAIFSFSWHNIAHYVFELEDGTDAKEQFEELSTYDFPYNLWQEPDGIWDDDAVYGDTLFHRPSEKDIIRPSAIAFEKLTVMKSIEELQSFLKQYEPSSNIEEATAEYDLTEFREQYYKEENEQAGEELPREEEPPLEPPSVPEPDDIKKSTLQPTKKVKPPSRLTMEIRRFLKEKKKGKLNTIPNFNSLPGPERTFLNDYFMKVKNKADRTKEIYLRGTVKSAIKRKDSPTLIMHCIEAYAITNNVLREQNPKAYAEHIYLTC